MIFVPGFIKKVDVGNFVFTLFFFQPYSNQSYNHDVFISFLYYSFTSYFENFLALKKSFIFFFLEHFEIYIY